MNLLNLKSNLLGLTAIAMLTSAAQAAASSETISTGVNGANNNIQTISTSNGKVTVDTNWTYEGFYDSYNLTRGDVFGSKVSNPNAPITDPINTSSATPYAPHYADVITGGNRPGWYNPGDGSQWLGVSPNEQNGGTPIDPPGNYIFRLNLSNFVNPNGGMVHLSIGEINADNHFEIAVTNSAQAQSFLLTPFATQETWNNPGSRNLSFNFSPKDGASLDFIIANANDQTSNGKYTYQKNPTGFLVDHMVITQSSGPTPAQDKLVSTKSLVTSVSPGSGPVMRPKVVAAPEPGTWLTMASFGGMAAWQIRRKKSLKLSL